MHGLPRRCDFHGIACRRVWVWRRALGRRGFDHLGVHESRLPWISFLQDPAIDPTCPGCGADVREVFYDTVNGIEDEGQEVDYREVKVRCPRCRQEFLITALKDRVGVFCARGYLAVSSQMLRLTTCKRLKHICEQFCRPEANQSLYRIARSAVTFTLQIGYSSAFALSSVTFAFLFPICLSRKERACVSRTGGPA